MKYVERFCSNRRSICNLIQEEADEDIIEFPLDWTQQFPTNLEVTRFNHRAGRPQFFGINILTQVEDDSAKICNRLEYFF